MAPNASRVRLQQMPFLSSRSISYGPQKNETRYNNRQNFPVMLLQEIKSPSPPPPLGYFTISIIEYAKYNERREAYVRNVIYVREREKERFLPTCIEVLLERWRFRAT